MAITVRASQGNWDGTLLTDIEAVARSAASCFSPFDEGEKIQVALESTATEEDLPIVLTAPNQAGELVIRLNVRGNLWARLAFQFAHELCHVMADITTWRGPRDRFGWIEEALCETASLFALRRMAETWAVDPPFEQWRDYAPSLADYEARRTAAASRSLPPELTFLEWLRDRLPLLEADACRRDDNTVIAKELLPLFEAHPAGWRAVRSLHAWEPTANASLADFMKGWEEAASADARDVVKSIAETFDAGT